MESDACSSICIVHTAPIGTAMTGDVMTGFLGIVIPAGELRFPYLAESIKDLPRMSCSSALPDVFPT
jgi:hypothetical protein